MSVQSATISGRLTIDMHSLNNEGGEGNQIQTRMVHIVDGNGELAVVNAISGDMLKHIQAEHLYTIASDGAHLPLCAGCRRFDANRVNADTEFFGGLPSEASGEEIIDLLLPYCAMDDAEGILITAGKRSVGRKSTVEFGWAVGVPEKTRTESYFHVKYDTARGPGSGDQTGANLGQNIFYRPASSGVYAVIVNVDLRRVGWNDISRKQVVEGEELARRRRAVWESVLHTFLKPTGAQRNTQHPHILAFEGVISWSASAVPAPSISALQDRYADEIEGIAAALERLHAGAVNTARFGSAADLADRMVLLAEEI